jgi:hypothetical protein
VAVSLRLFMFRAAELTPRVRPFLLKLPAALTPAAAAVDALADVHRPAAVAVVAAAAAAHQKATETQVTEEVLCCEATPVNAYACCSCLVH